MKPGGVESGGVESVGICWGIVGTRRERGSSAWTRTVSANKKRMVVRLIVRRKKNPIYIGLYWQYVRKKMSFERSPGGFEFIRIINISCFR